jgi:hypothetical protein
MTRGTDWLGQNHSKRRRRGAAPGPYDDSSDLLGNAVAK